MQSLDPLFFQEKLKVALKIQIPHREPWGKDLKAPENPLPAAVLMLWAFPSLTEPGWPHLLFIRRAQELRTHRGQFAFPGGRVSEGEESAVAALRETHEEVGIDSGSVELQGELPALLTSSAFWVTPWIARLRIPLAEALCAPQRGEVEEVFWLSWQELRAPRVYQLEEWEFEVRGQKIYKEVDVFRVGDRVIWGATGSMLWNFFKRWDEVN